MTAPLLLRLGCLVLYLAAAGASLRGDNNVVVNAAAQPDYTARRLTAGKLRRERYAFMAGRYFSGSTVDHSVDRMPFQRIAEILVPRLAAQNFVPARKLAEVELLIVVHWGTTRPRVTTEEMQGRTGSAMDFAHSLSELKRTEAALESARANGTSDPIMEREVMGMAAEIVDVQQANQLEQRAAELSESFMAASNAQLLGYTKALRQMNQKAFPDEIDRSLHRDLQTERYFVILRAYDLRSRGPDGKPQPVWTLHLNISSPGNNFGGAIEKMALAAANYAGRTTDGITTIRPGVRQGTVELGEPIVIGAQKPPQ